MTLSPDKNGSYEVEIPGQELDDAALQKLQGLADSTSDSPSELLNKIERALDNLKSQKVDSGTVTKESQQKPAQAPSRQPSIVSLAAIVLLLAAMAFQVMVLLRTRPAASGDLQKKLKEIDAMTRDLEQSVRAVLSQREYERASAPEPSRYAVAESAHASHRDSAPQPGSRSTLADLGFGSFDEPPADHRADARHRPETSKIHESYARPEPFANPDPYSRPEPHARDPYAQPQVASRPESGVVAEYDQARNGRDRAGVVERFQRMYPSVNLSLTNGDELRANPRAVPQFQQHGRGYFLAVEQAGQWHCFPSLFHDLRDDTFKSAFDYRGAAGGRVTRPAVLSRQGDLWTLASRGVIENILS